MAVAFDVEGFEVGGREIRGYQGEETRDGVFGLEGVRGGEKTAEEGVGCA